MLHYLCYQNIILSYKEGSINVQHKCTVMLQFSRIEVAEKNHNVLNYFDLFDSPCLISLCGRSDETAERETKIDCQGKQTKRCTTSFLLSLPNFGALNFCIL